MTSTGDIVTSSTGMQKKCGLSSPLFVVIIEYLNIYTTTEGELTTKLWYMEDGALHARLTKKCCFGCENDWNTRKKTGLRLNWSKCFVN